MTSSVMSEKAGGKAEAERIGRGSGAAGDSHSAPTPRRWYARWPDPPARLGRTLLRRAAPLGPREKLFGVDVSFTSCSAHLRGEFVLHLDVLREY